jgi:hypothetical protein
MANPWFRMYSEFSHDPKVQMLSEVMQRRYIMLMCLRCSNTLVTLHETEVAFHLRISDEEIAETKALFIAKGFIDDSFNLLNWEKRQFASDTSATRVAKHRALQKEKQTVDGNADVTLLKRKSNVPDTDTDTDKNNPPMPPKGGDRFDAFWLAYPKKVGKDAARKAFDKRKVDVELLATMLAAISAQTKSSMWAKDAGQYIPNPATWLNEGRWMDGGVTIKPVEDWFVSAGFDNVHEARNMGCSPSTAHLFHDGQKVEVAN